VRQLLAFGPTGTSIAAGAPCLVIVIVSPLLTLSSRSERCVLAFEGHPVLVPAVWALEITNAIVVAERRKRVGQPEVRRFVELLDGLTINEVSLPVAASVSNILPLAREYGLSAYDASYLDVAIRHSAPLATLDSGLEKAGRSAGGEILQEPRRPKLKRYRTE
jgi:predicted nucleic acid-binding protein